MGGCRFGGAGVCGAEGYKVMGLGATGLRGCKIGGTGGCGVVGLGGLRSCGLRGEGLCFPGCSIPPIQPGVGAVSR